MHRISFLIPVVFISIFLTNKLNANIYEDVFTRDIYDQSDAARNRFAFRANYKINKTYPTDSGFSSHPLEEEIADFVWSRVKNITNDRYKNTRIGTLYFQKLLCVEEKLVGNIRKQLECLESIVAGLKRTAIGKVGAAGVKAAIGSTLDWFARATLNPGATVGGTVASIGAKLLGFSCDTGANLQDDLQKHIGEIEKGITELKLEIKKYQEGVMREPIKELEESYVLKKEGMREDHRYNIENNLINSRKPLYPFPFIKQCLEQALALPTTHKRLDTEALLTKFSEEEFFQSFHSSTINDLESAIVSISQYSQREPNGVIPVRGIYYFWGDPGVGKSRTGQEFAKLLEVPFWRCSIRNAASLSPENLEGSSCLGPIVNPGWLARPLLAYQEGDANKTTYKNPVLILEDFDRVLLDEQSGISSLAFILDYFDPLKRDFFSPYFNAQIDISRMNIIISANFFPEGDKFKALRERFTKIVRFFPFEEEKKESILVDFTRTAIGHYGISPSEFTKGLNSEFEKRFTSETRALEFVAEKAVELADNPDSIRSCERTVEGILSSVKIRSWKDKRTTEESELKPKKITVQKVVTSQSSKTPATQKKVVEEKKSGPETRGTSTAKRTVRGVATQSPKKPAPQKKGKGLGQNSATAAKKQRRR